mgnify:CR=1 FL=1
MTAIICTITPSFIHQEESLSTLKFASRAKTIKNKPTVNEVLDNETMLQRYAKEIHQLKQQLQKMSQHNAIEPVVPLTTSVSDSTMKELELLRDEKQRVSIANRLEFGYLLILFRLKKKNNGCTRSSKNLRITLSQAAETASKRRIDVKLGLQQVLCLVAC